MLPFAALALCLHLAPLGNGVRTLPGTVYGQPGGRPLTLDLYLPPAAAHRPPAGFPLVVYIHGGGWSEGDSRSTGPFSDFPGVLAALAARGYVVASVNYRLSGEARFPAQIQDVQMAIRWLRSRAPDYAIDPARALTWGVSAGGHLAALAAVACGAAALAPESGTPAAGCVQGAVAWYGVFDLAATAEQAGQARDVLAPMERQLLGCPGQGPCPPAQLAAASPVSYIDPGDPPMLLITGDQDRIVPCRQTLEMAERLQAAGVRREVLVLPGLDHGFAGRTPEQTRLGNRKALEATFRFIDRTIGPAAGSRP